MAQPQLEPIYLLVTDLASLKPRNWNISAFSDSELNLNIFHFAPFKHWALQIRDRCYEVNAVPGPKKSNKPNYDLNNYVSLAKWQKQVKEKKLRWERVQVGATTCSDRDIIKHSTMIWADRFRMKYRLDKQNCQNFCYVLYDRIAIDPKKIKNEMNEAWRRMPNRFTEISHFVKSCLSSSIARAILFEYVAEAVVLGAEIIGIESILSLEIIGMEAVGAALLGPVGEVIFAVAIIAFILKKSHDKKWLTKQKLREMAGKSKPVLPEESPTDERLKIRSEHALNEHIDFIMNEIAKEEETELDPADQTLLPMEEESRAITKSQVARDAMSRFNAIKSKVTNSVAAKNPTALAKPKKTPVKSRKEMAREVIQARAAQEAEEDEMLKAFLSFSDRQSRPEESAEPEEAKVSKSEPELDPQPEPKLEPELAALPAASPPPYNEVVQIQSNEYRPPLPVRRKPLPPGAVTACGNGSASMENVLSAR